MRTRKSLYLSSFVANQYPIEKLKKIIYDVVDIVDNFILELNEENNIDSSSISKYEKRLGSFQAITSSRVESICFERSFKDKKKKEFILKYGIAVNYLNKLEKDVFILTFVKGESNISIIGKLHLNSEQLTIIRKSAIVRFSLKMGLDKFLTVDK